ncbi:hypothetical protein BDV10DRAFT_189525 [Aspergillus recurvatus]
MVGDDNDGEGVKHNPRSMGKFHEYAPEAGLLFEVKDICNEIGMIRTVLDHPRVLLKLGGKLRHTNYGCHDPLSVLTGSAEQNRVVYMLLKHLDRMDRQAAHLYQSTFSLSDLKLKHANKLLTQHGRENPSWSSPS